jgi:ribosomal-protein-alanine N-acetyltransferase
MLLRGTRCLVRPWRPGDAASLVRHANNINIARHLRDRFPHPYTRADAESFLTWSSGAESGGANLAIEVEGEAAGGVGFNPGTDVERHSAEIGYWLGEAYWGRGIVTEAVVMLTDCLFASHNFLRLFALPFAGNAASVRVLEKAGYQREAVLRSSSVKYGEPRDQLLYARINADWRAEPSSSQRI